MYGIPEDALALERGYTILQGSEHSSRRSVILIRYFRQHLINWDNYPAEFNQRTTRKKALNSIKVLWSKEVLNKDVQTKFQVTLTLTHTYCYARWIKVYPT